VEEKVPLPVFSTLIFDIMLMYFYVSTVSIQTRLQLQLALFRGIWLSIYHSLIMNEIVNCVYESDPVDIGTRTTRT
jgi:hypothetical protein